MSTNLSTPAATNSLTLDPVAQHFDEIRFTDSDCAAFGS